MSDTNLSAFIWSVADLLRGDYKQSDYGKVILPFTVLRRLDCVLSSTKAAVLEEKTLREGQGLDPEPFMLRKAEQLFCNSSALDMQKLMGDADNIGENLRSYVQAFSPAVRDIFESFKFHLALANSECREYITEKFWTNSLMYDVVPVVYGAPKADFEKLAPPNSFIHVSDFSTLEDLADYIKLLDQNDDMYLKYFEWKTKGAVTTYFPVTLPTLCNIVPHLFNGTTQSIKTIKNSPWYNNCRETRPNPHIPYKTFVKEIQIKKYPSWKPWKLDVFKPNISSEVLSRAP